MHLVCDFDDTLTNTTKYWNFWLDKLETIGIKREHAIEVGTQLLLGPFTLRGHLIALGVQEDVALSVLQDMELHLKEFGKSYIFSDIHPFLMKHNQTHSFSILTFGDESNQKWRIEQSGIAPLFERVSIADIVKRKVDHLSDLFKNSTTQIAFVDDSPHELNPVVDAGLPVKLFRIVRPGARHDYVHEGDDVVWKRIGSIDEIDLS